MNLSFDAATHTYRLDGNVVPSVTQVLGPLYALDRIPPAVLEHKRQIGNALDALIEFDLRDDLDESTIDPALDGYFRAWRLFRKEKGFTPVELQKRVASVKYRYAGTPDAWGVIDGRPAIPDWKATYAMHPAVALQLAAYEHAIVESVVGSPKHFDRYGVQFREDGHYILTPYREKTDFGIFLSLLSVHNWRARNKCLPKERT